MPATRPTLPPRFAVTSCSLGAVLVAADEGPPTPSPSPFPATG
jgi:hypothetical protein